MIHFKFNEWLNHKRWSAVVSPEYCRNHDMIQRLSLSIPSGSRGGVLHTETLLTEYTLFASWVTGKYASFAWNHTSPLWMKLSWRFYWRTLYVCTCARIQWTTWRLPNRLAYLALVIGIKDGSACSIFPLAHDFRLSVKVSRTFCKTLKNIWKIFVYF